MKKLSVTNLKKHLNSKSNAELVNEIIGLYQKFSDVKDYYALTLSKDGMADVLEKYKKIVQNEFFPSRGFGKLRLSVARKAVNDFKKMSTSNVDIADIMLFYVESGVEFTNAYGDINESFYSSIESMYEAALKHICKSELVEDFYTHCEEVVNDTSGIGWGFHDTLADLFGTYMETEQAEEDSPLPGK